MDYAFLFSNLPPKNLRVFFVKFAWVIFVDDNPQPIFHGLEQLLVDGDLHVQGDLGIQQGLIHPQLFGEVTLELLDLGIFDCRLKHVK